MNNENKGVLFKNDKKEKETHPDYTGKINIEGVDHYLSCWVNKSEKTGKNYMSLSIGKVVQANNEVPASAPAPAGDDLDDDVPFANPYKRHCYMV